ncbi:MULTISPECIES: hypothetical protein [Fusobacterium]|uniref:Uncharacterized protein n=1 Tax=Fusobacterium animalis TaxID=76859 RepID=A0A2B7YR31_9FUSO|nr:MULTISPECIES: hypothetical protein [Fusobacterium]PGH24126.1 hypothetical protein RN90_00890 [Fusobacterium animalis]WDD88772.1 hypothetical protein PSR68_10315 [Fusobacterium nucleatum]
MNEKLIELIKKICIFLKKEDHYKLKKIINTTKDSYPDFFPLMHEFEEHTLLGKIETVIEPIISSLTLPGVPFILFGKKAEEEENKAIFLEKISELKDEIRQFLDRAIIPKEVEFLTFLYKNI